MMLIDFRFGVRLKLVFYIGCVHLERIEGRATERS